MFFLWLVVGRIEVITGMNANNNLAYRQVHLAYHKCPTIFAHWQAIKNVSICID